MSDKNGVAISARVTKNMIEKIDKKVNSGKYMNRSDFVRQAIRRELGE